jgi:hypothetical protein
MDYGGGDNHPMPASIRFAK